MRVYYRFTVRPSPVRRVATKTQCCVGSKQIRSPSNALCNLQMDPKLFENLCVVGLMNFSNIFVILLLEFFR